jgi:ATP-dependent helicase HrpB
MFPVSTHYGAAYEYGERIAERCVSTITDALRVQTGSLLVFLPGQGEIRQVAQRLTTWLAEQQDRDEIQLSPLYGDLSLAEQRKAIAPCADGLRKIVLATNIAETSLTIDGVRVVIDSGLCRQPRFDPNTGMTRLSTARISKASSIQRAGRAGRLEPGVCYRLWSESQQDELAAFTPAEIQQADLAPLALQLLQWGVSDPSELTWLDTPSPAPYQQALDLLAQLRATKCSDGHLSLTPHGQAMSALPSHPRIAHMMLMGQSVGLTQQACELAAMLGERDLAQGVGADLSVRLDILRGETQVPHHQRGSITRLKQLQKQFLRLLPKHASKTHLPAIDEPRNHRWSALLLAWAYPDRVAAQRSKGSAQYLLSNGRAAALRDHDRLSKHRWLVVGELGGQQGKAQDQIYLAAVLEEALFDDYLTATINEEVVVEWDEQTGKLVAEERRMIGRLRISSRRLSTVSSEQRASALLGLVRKRGLGLMNWSKELQQWRARIGLLREVNVGTSDNPWPDVSDSGLLANLEAWLLPYLDRVTTLNHFKQLDTPAMLSTLLPWPLPAELDRLAPLRMSVPSGSNISIDYSQSPPVLAVKLQEMFGCEQTPSIAQGKVNLLVHLLSPARHPLQVTQDLAGFWRGSYQDVKKDMKGRYPKHPWPDNPLEAFATKKTKRRLAE